MIKLTLKIILGLMVLLTGLAVALYVHMQSHTVVVTVDEIIPADEEQQTQRAINNFIQVIDETNSGLATRGAHAKGHACVKAYFDINQDIDPQLQHGIFKTAGQRYKSWIRFSNGSSNLVTSDDTKKDSRGMAIKVIGLANTPELIGSGTQDFLMHNSPAFFSTDLNDYNQLVESEDKLKYFINGLNPFNWRLREVSHVIDTLAPPPYSPVWTDYFSNTAYKLGPHNIKFMTSSCTTAPSDINPNSTHPDFLQTTLAEELVSNSACMQLSIQLQDASKLMPIEDVSVLWKETDSPFIPVATLTIIKQKFDSPEQQHYCENLSFSPWNTLPDHRPIGALNRVRKAVYQASSDYRHKMNKQATSQPIEWVDNK